MIPNSTMIPAFRWSPVIRWSPAIWWSPAIRWSIGRMDFDNSKVYGDTSITDGLVKFPIPFRLLGATVKKTPQNQLRSPREHQIGRIRVHFRVTCVLEVVNLDTEGKPVNHQALLCKWLKISKCLKGVTYVARGPWCPSAFWTRRSFKNWNFRFLLVGHVWLVKKPSWSWSHRRWSVLTT